MTELKGKRYVIRVWDGRVFEADSMDVAVRSAKLVLKGFMNDDDYLRRHKEVKGVTTLVVTTSFGEETDAEAQIIDTINGDYVIENWKGDLSW